MNTDQKLLQNQELLNGPLPFSMCNDFLFKILLQDVENNILKSLICAFIDLKPEEIKSVVVTNAISLDEDIDSKEMILDIRAEMNDNTIINLEMQVINYFDWPERSISYLCRCFDNLKKGFGYSQVKGAVHIGFLDFTLFQDNKKFYATYRLLDEENGYLYSSKFRLSVVDLTLRDKATENDKASHRDLWASFFKARSWEDLLMLAKQDENIKTAVQKVHQLSENEMFRLRCEAREDKIRQELDMKNHYQSEIAERDKVIYEQGSAIDELRVELSKKDEEIAEQGKIITEQGSALDELRRELSEKDKDMTEIQSELAELKKMFMSLTENNNK